MTNIELLTPYFNNIGIRFVKGDTQSVEPVAVFILQDLIYQTFEKEIRDVPFSHQAAKLKNDWRKANDAQFKHFFHFLKGEREDKIIDLMDDFEDKTGNELMIIKCKIMDGVNGVDFESQKLLASIQLCNLLSQVSDIHWGGMQRKRYGKEVTMRYNRQVRYFTKELSRIVFENAGGKSINRKAEDELIEALASFEKKFCRWIKEKSGPEN